MTTSSASGYVPVLGVSSPRSGEAACSTGCRSRPDCRLGSPKRSTTQVRLAAVATSPTRPRARCAIRRSFGQAARSSGFLGSRARRMHASPRAQAPTHLSAGLPTPPPLPIRPRRSPRSGEAVESDLSGSCPAISSDAFGANSLGEATGWSFSDSNNQTAVIFHDSIVQPIGPGQGAGINDHDVVVANGPNGPYIWKGGVTRDLNERIGHRIWLAHLRRLRHQQRWTDHLPRRAQPDLAELRLPPAHTNTRLKRQGAWLERGVSPASLTVEDGSIRQWAASASKLVAIVKASEC
jgi:hypothetical protein